MKRFLFLILAFGLLVPDTSFAISVYIHNTLKESEPGAVLEITNVKGIGVSQNQKMLVMPGERRRVAARHVTAFMVSRVYGDYKTLFDIKCPEDVRIKDILTIGFSEVEKNSIGAGCEVLRQGRMSLESGITWQSKKK